MDPDGSTDHCLLAEMADDMKVLKQNNNDVVLEVSTHKASLLLMKLLSTNKSQ